VVGERYRAQENSKSVERLSAASGTVTIRDYQNAVDGQVQAGFTFGQVEDFINACAIEEGEKAALWLSAWRQQPGDVRRTFADAQILDFARAYNCASEPSIGAPARSSFFDSLDPDLWPE
jgi:hypothetical protein